MYWIARVVSEVDFGQSHMNDQYFHAHNAALIAVLVLGNNGYFGFSSTLVREEGKKYYSCNYSHSCLTVCREQLQVKHFYSLVKNCGKAKSICPI